MRFSRIAAVLFAISLSAPVMADDILVINLPSFQTDNSRTDTRAAPPAPSNAVDRHGGVRVNEDQKVLGHLGIVETTAPLRLQPDANIRPVARIIAGTYIALKSQKGEWYGVLLQDQGIGWVPTKYVKVLDYDVVSTAPLPSRGVTGDERYFRDNPLLSAQQKTILETAYSYLGVPYKWGGTTVEGMDCSGFVQKCFAAAGITLPRTAHEQINYGEPVQADQLQPADRLYFADRSGAIVHTGIYIGNGYFIHASSLNHAVSISKLSDPLYQRMYAGARR